MNAHVPRQVLDLGRQLDHLLGDVAHLRRLCQPVPPADLLAPRILLPLRKAQGASHVPDRAARPVGDDVGDLCGIVAAVAVVDVLDHQFALIRFDVDVDVGRPVAGRGQEAFEEQVVGDGIHRRDAQGVTDRGVGGRSPALAQDPVLPAEPGDVVHHQEIARERQVLDDRQFVVDLGVGARGALRRAVAVGGARQHQLAQPAVLGVAVGDVERRQLRGDQLQAEGALLAQFGRGGDGVGEIGEQLRHLVAGPQMRAAQRGQPPGGLVEGLPRADGTHGHGQPAAGRLGEVRARGRHHRHPEATGQPREGRVGLVLAGVAVPAQFDADPVLPEAVHQVGQRRLRGLRATLRKGLAHMPFPTPGQDVPVPAGRLGQRVEVVPRFPFLTAGEVGGRQLPGQPAVALGPTGQDQQVRPGRVRGVGAGDVAQR